MGKSTKQNRSDKRGNKLRSSKTDRRNVKQQLVKEIRNTSGY